MAHPYCDFLSTFVSGLTRLFLPILSLIDYNGLHFWTFMDRKAALYVIGDLLSKKEWKALKGCKRSVERMTHLVMIRGESSTYSETLWLVF